MPSPMHNPPPLIVGQSANTQSERPIDAYLKPPDIHEAARVPRGGIPSLILSVILLLGESRMLYYIGQGAVTPSSAFWLHGIISILLLGYATLALRFPDENRFALLLALSVITLGPFGAGGMVLCIMEHLWTVRREHGMALFFQTLFPRLTLDKARRVHENLRTGRDESHKSYSVIPFLDVLTFGNELQKRQALSKMGNQFHPNFAAAFKKALQDESNSIRVQAAMAVATIDADFQEKILALTAIYKKYPNTPVVILALAELYDDYSYTGLLDPDRERVNRQKALALYNEYIGHKQNDNDIRRRIGRLLMRGKQYDKACDWFRACMKNGADFADLSDWFTEALFLCGHYDELRIYLQGIKTTLATPAPNPSVLNDAWTFWAEGRA